MTVDQLISYLQKNYSGDTEVLIDMSTDGGFSNERELIEQDIQEFDNNQIIIRSIY